MLGLGPKITGESVSEREIKQIFLICSHVGFAIQNLLFYEEMTYQKTCTENLLEHATSGILSADSEQRITSCNPRARQVLGLD